MISGLSPLNNRLKTLIFVYGFKMGIIVSCVSVIPHALHLNINYDFPGTKYFRLKYGNLQVNTFAHINL